MDYTYTIDAMDARAGQVPIDLTQCVDSDSRVELIDDSRQMGYDDRAERKAAVTVELPDAEESYTREESVSECLSLVYYSSDRLAGYLNAELRIRTTMEVRLRRAGHGFVAESPELELTESGATRDDAIRNLCEFLAEDFHSYTKADDSELTPRAAQIKAKYLKLIERV